MQYGTKAIGSTKCLAQQNVFEPSKTYEIDIQAEGITDPESTVDYLLGELQKQYPQIEVTWIQVGKSRINFQFRVLSAQTLGYQTKPLSVAAIIPWLSSIFSLIGIAIMLISVLLIYQTVPWYIWGLLTVGAVFIIWGPDIAKMLTPKIQIAPITIG